MESSYEVTMLGPGRVCANPPSVAELGYYVQTVTILEHSSHPLVIQLLQMHLRVRMPSRNSRVLPSLLSASQTALMIVLA